MGHTGLVYHPAYLDHDMGAGHPESPNRLGPSCSSWSGAAQPARSDRIEPRKAEDEWITQIHTPSYVAACEHMPPASGRVSLDADTSMSPGSLPAAYLAAGRGIGGRRCDHARRRRACVLRGAAAWASCGSRAGDGLLPLQQRGHCGSLRAEKIWSEPRAHRRLGRASWKRYAA